MLVLGVQEGDYIMINKNIRIWVSKTGESFKLGIDAPKEYEILRSKIYQEQNPEEIVERPKRKQKN